MPKSVIFAKILTGNLLDFWQESKMLEWKEWDHELNDQVALNDNATIDALCNYGLLKFFMCPGLQAQPLLLQRLVVMWDSDSQHFVVGDQVLEMDVDDIYFLTRLSH